MSQRQGSRIWTSPAAADVDADVASREFLRAVGFADVALAENFLSNVLNLSAADQGEDFSDASSAASWSSCG